MTQLGVMQTADTLGKGGYTTSVGMFQVDRKNIDVTPKQPQRVVIGNFEGLHNVEFEVNTFLIPAQLTYGIGERLDLLLGATFSTGGARKIVPDFYRIGDTYDADESIDRTQDRRVYEQSIFDLVVGLKHNIKPDLQDGLPGISIGGDVQLGFTADDQLNSDKEFADASPADSFPFMGINTYLVGTQRFGQFMRVHAGVGSYLSSKSLKSTDSFQLLWQLGTEFAFSDNFWLVADFSRRRALSGITINDLIGIGFRYKLSDTAAFNIGFVTEPGFQFYLTVGGDKGGAAPPETGEADLLF
ncbi:hypothetical protein J4G02_02115 [Candidatus Poribacteria bacterium]|nr:hypothetical protein [Candidatus Poribacteria bacterium]